MRGMSTLDTGDVPVVPQMTLLKWLWDRVKHHKKKIIGIIFALVGLVSTTVFQPLLIRELIDKHLVVGANASSSEILTIGIKYLILVLLAFYLSWWTTRSLGRLANEVMYELRRDLFNRLVSLKVSFFEKTPVGVIVHRVSNDVQSISDLFTQVLTTLVSDLFLIVGVTIAMIRIAPSVSLWVLIPLPIIVAIMPTFSRWVFRLFDIIRNRSTEMIISLNEILRGLALLRAFNSEKETDEKYFDLNQKTYVAHMDSIKSFSLFDPFVSLCFYFSMAILFLKGIPLINVDSGITVGILIAMLSYTKSLYQPMHDIAHKIHLIQSSLAGVGKVHWLMNINDPDEWNHSEKQINPWPLEGSFKSENLVFAYTENKTIIDGIDFELNKGKKLAIVGSTGAGKSTLVKLLMAYYSPQKGRIFAGKHSHFDANLDSWRKGIAFLPQEVTLFNRSILDNIRLHKDIPKEKIENIIKILGFEDRVNSMKDGLETVLAEGGKDLSLGERQLISIARALVFDPEVLVLDEATSSIDPELELIVNKAINKLLQGRTGIIIAHRLSTVRQADEILVVDQGKIKERGTHDQLMKKKGQYYYLIRLQMEN
ncbi:hypothetical protein CL645_05495 [bacterium]|nr:hypothetical protein [bacterium]|tara:strand:- start:200 stop:1987 length:1788 start_codon:yes stop_codon:yes gene_type:complete